MALFATLLIWQIACSNGTQPSGTTPSPQQTPTTPLPQPTLPPAQTLPVDKVIGKPGSGPGQFNEPAGIALDSKGNLYVADIVNHRVQKFGPKGEFLAQVGGRGPGNGQFNEPWGVAVDGQGNVYVVDTFNHRVQKFDSNLKFILAFGTPASNLENPEPASFWGPRDLAVDPSGNVWISDTGTGRIVKWSPDGKFVQKFGGMGSGRGQFKEATAIEISSTGEIFIADSGNRRVQRFDPNFNFIAEYPIPGWLYVDSAAKPYLALLPDGGLIASDPTQNKLFRLDTNGNAIATLDAKGKPLVLPRGLAFDAGRGFLYVSEHDPDQIRRLVLNVTPS